MPITQYNSSVRQMSQSKFDSMKNASGKIPDLANQIVMTNSEDTNTSCLRTKVLWTNQNPNTSFEAQNITLSDGNYEYLEVILRATTGLNRQYSVKIKKGNGANFLTYYVVTWSPYNYDQFRTADYISDTEYSISDNYRRSTDKSDIDISNDQNIPIEIIGYYKTPSMIYTGDELIAGNGISIENGEVKVDQNVLNSIDNKETIAGLNAVDISNISFSSLRDCLSYLASDLTKTYYCYIGDAESCSFKNFVGNPNGFGNYTLCLIKPIGKLTNQNVGIYTGSVYQCIAVGTIVNKLAIGYIFNGENAMNETKFSGWKVLYYEAVI